MRMLAILALLWIHSPLIASDPLDPIDRALLVQKAMNDAKDLLTAGDSPAAAKALEEQLPHANVNRAYLDLLRKAYAGELTKLRAAPAQNATRIEQITKRLAILDGGHPKNEIIQASATTSTHLADAIKKFHDGKRDPKAYREAAEAFGKANAAGEILNDDQKASWAYCLVRRASEECNQPGLSDAEVQKYAREIRSALALAPHHAGLQQLGKNALQAIATTASSDWQTLEQSGFRVKFKSQADVAKAILQEAVKQRNDLTAKWFGPAGAAWSPACEIIIHDSANDFAKATKLSAQLTGHAEVTLDAGQVASRRIDLRADDANLRAVSLPRELLHVVLADLFPMKAPPRWAEEGMAIVSTNAAEVSRYKKAIPRLQADGQMLRASELLTMTGFPSAEKTTAFYVGSVTLTEYLVSLKGEKTFTSFLTDAQRYGVENALKRQYQLTPAQLDGVWLK